MHIQKTHGNIESKSTAQTKAQVTKPESNAVSKAAQSTAPKVSPSSSQQAGARSVASVISAAGLPGDKLSASIVSFARFFSLPLKPELLKHIRQQAFEGAQGGMQKTAQSNAQNVNAPDPNPAAEDSEPKSGVVFNKREALSLAAAAAEGKGVELQPKGLEAYAQAVDPDWRRRQDSEQGDQRGRRRREENENGEEHSQKIGTLSAEDLKKAALEEAGKNHVLAILNRLPSKDGKRWIVLPFDFSDDGREFKVSLRILLETGKVADRADCMALDIAIRDTVENGKNEKRWLFVLEPANRLSVYLTTCKRSGEKEKTELVRELSALLEIAPERVFIKSFTGSFPFEADGGNDFLRSIDEAV